MRASTFLRSLPCAVSVAVLLACNDDARPDQDVSTAPASSGGQSGELQPALDASRSGGGSDTPDAADTTKTASETAHTSDAGTPHTSDAGATSITDAGTTSTTDTGIENADAAAPGPRIVFDDPTFFSLPINSIRSAVSGHDPATGLCITVAWYLNGVERDCDQFGDQLFPYVYIEADAPAGCWDYGPNAELLAIRGCPDYQHFGLGTMPSTVVELEVNIKSDLWSGTVRFDNVP